MCILPYSEAQRDAELVKDFWKGRCPHSIIKWSTKSAVLDSNPALTWGKCLLCDIEGYYPIGEDQS